MKTNVMIRIDKELAEKARTVGLNISQISENALRKEIEFRHKPVRVIASHDVVAKGKILRYEYMSPNLQILWDVYNRYEHDVYLDRIVFYATLYEHNDEADELSDRKIIEKFEGAQLSRITIRKGVVGSFANILKLSEPTIKKLNEELQRKSNNIRLDLTGEINVESQGFYIQGLFESLNDVEIRYHHRKDEHNHASAEDKIPKKEVTDKWEENQR